MAKDIAALNQNLDDMQALFVQYQTALATAETQKAQLVQDVLTANQTAADAVAAMNIAQADKAAAQAAFDQANTDIAAAVDKSDAVENQARAGLPGVPPIVTPTDPATPPTDPDPTTPTEPAVVGILAAEYADKASFDAAVAAYTGAEGVTLDGAEVKAKTSASLPGADYFTHSATGVINTSGPTD